MATEADPTDAQILEAAKRATPGPWENDEPGCVAKTYEGASGKSTIAVCGDMRTASGQDEADARYIALLSPSVVARLIERAQALDRAEREIRGCLGRDGAPQNDGIKLALHKIESVRQRKP